MALRVWLPLNGTLENKGISDYVIQSANITIVDNGKIGKCYSFNGSSSYISITNFNLSNNWSYGCWINTPNSDSRGWEIAMILNNSGSDADSQFAFWVHQKENRFESLANTQYTSTIPYTNYYNSWHHFFATFNGSLLTTYIDGSVVNTKTITAEYYPATNLTIGARSKNAAGTDFTNWFQGYLNDVRVYDHCLSQKEVKEISQGLVLHYKLDQLSQGSGHNLVTGLTSGGQTTVVNDTIVTSGQNSDTYFRINLSSALTLNKSYTMGIDAENLPDGDYFRFPIGSQNNSSAGYINIYNGHNEAVFIANDVIVNNGTLLMMDDNARTAWPNQCIFKNFYIYENTSIADSSGYENDGTITGTLSTESDSNRYEISTHYSGSSYTDTGSGTFNWFNFSQCTLSAWIKPTASVSGWSGSIGVQHNQTAGHKGFTITDYANNFRVVTVNGSYTTIDSGKPLTVGEWHHCAAVLNGTNLKMYYDGSIVKESTVSWGSAAIATDMRFATGVDFPGSDEMFTGNYSDIRMYCTALSAEDILDLYHTSANVDNLGNLHGFEFVEDNIPYSIKENGQIYSDNFFENSYIKYLKYDTTIYEEPDGSEWIRIFHHNDPTTSGYFTKASDWEHGVYVDENKWYNIEEIVYTLPKYEFMVKQKTTSSSTEAKYRWIQDANPLEAAWADVKPGTVTFNTSSGYTNSSMGGLWKMNSSARMCIASTSSGNWYGALGSWTVYNTNQVPGFPNTNISTGYIDLYARIYPPFKITKDLGMNSNNFIEK